MSRHEDEALSGLKPIEGQELSGLREAYRLWNAGGLEAMTRHVWHPDIEYHDPPDFPDAGAKRGARAVAEHLGARLEALPDVSVELEGAWWVSEGELAIAKLALQASGQSSGIELDTAMVHVFRLDEQRRATELREYRRMDQALEALEGV